MATLDGILLNSTITTAGSAIYRAGPAQEVTIVINIIGTPTGTTPTLTFTLSEVDPSDESTLVGLTKSTLPLTAAGATTLTMLLVNSTAAKISWVVGGTTPSFSGVYVSAFAKLVATPNTALASSAGFALGTVTTTATTQTAVRASTYNEQTTNAQRSISSASASDAAAGTGARQVSIKYLDQTGAGPFTETVTLNGTTAVNTVNTNICYIESITVVSVGSGGSNAGILTLFVSTAGGGGTLATINAGDNQDLWAHHYVPTGKTCNITGFSGHNNNSSNGSILVIKTKPIGGTSPEIQVSDFVRVGAATAQVVRLYNTPIKVTGPARTLAYSSAEGTPSIITRVAFDFYDI